MCLCVNNNNVSSAVISVEDVSFCADRISEQFDLLLPVEIHLFNFQN